MKVRLLKDAELDGKDHPAGSVIEVSESDARVLICSGAALGYKEPKAAPTEEKKQPAPARRQKKGG